MEERFVEEDILFRRTFVQVDVLWKDVCGRTFCGRTFCEGTFCRKDVLK